MRGPHELVRSGWKCGLCGWRFKKCEHYCRDPGDDPQGGHELQPDSPHNRLSGKEEVNELEGIKLSHPNIPDGRDSLGVRAHDNRLTTQVLNGSAVKEFCIWASIVCAIICPFLDEGIIATAIPRITDEFESINHIGWYGSAYLMMMSAFQLIYGQLYSKFDSKSIFLISLAIFEIGSVVCATSSSSIILILGRGIAGIGAAGLSSGVFALFALALPASKLPVYIGAMGAVYGISAVVGPILGGVITSSYLTWRWCFYINLPIAIPPIIAVIFFIHSGSPRQATSTTPGFHWKETAKKLKDLDYLGMVLLIPSMCCLVTALEFGGSTTHGWQDGRTIGLISSSLVLAILFGVSQWWMGEKALLPLRIISDRLVWSCSLFTISHESAFLTLVYFLPAWFQAIHDISPSEAGIRYLALCIPFAISILSSGWLVSRCGYVQPFMLVGTILVSIAGGLLSTLKPSSSPTSWILYQIIAGIGIGAATDQPGVAVQSLMNEADAPMGVAAVLFCNNLGPTIALSISNAIFMAKLVRDIPVVFPDLDGTEILASGATRLRGLVADEDVPRLVQIYNDALTGVFIVVCVFACSGIFGILAFGKRRIVHDKPAHQSHSESGPEPQKQQS